MVGGFITILIPSKTTYILLIISHYLLQRPALSVVLSLNILLSPLGSILCENLAVLVQLFLNYFRMSQLS
jgi:hypothetical protein